MAVRYAPGYTPGVGWSGGVSPGQAASGVRYVGSGGGRGGTSVSTGGTPRGASSSEPVTKKVEWIPAKSGQYIEGGRVISYVAGKPTGSRAVRPSDQGKIPTEQKTYQLLEREGKYSSDEGKTWKSTRTEAIRATSPSREVRVSSPYYTDVTGQKFTEEELEAHPVQAAALRYAASQDALRKQAGLAPLPRPRIGDEPIMLPALEPSTPKGAVRGSALGGLETTYTPVSVSDQLLMTKLQDTNFDKEADMINRAVVGANMAAIAATTAGAEKAGKAKAAEKIVTEFGERWGGKELTTGAEAYEYVTDKATTDKELAALTLGIQKAGRKETILADEQNRMVADIKKAISIYEGKRQAYPEYAATQFQEKVTEELKAVPLLPSTERLTESTFAGAGFGLVLGTAGTLVTGGVSIPAATLIGGLYGAGAAIGGQAFEYGTAQAALLTGQKYTPYAYNKITDLPIVGEVGLPSFDSASIEAAPTLGQYWKEPSKYPGYRAYDPRETAKLSGVAGELLGGLALASGASKVAQAGAAKLYEYRTTPTKFSQGEVTTYTLKDPITGQYETTAFVKTQPIREIKLGSRTITSFETGPPEVMSSKYKSGIIETNIGEREVFFGKRAVTSGRFDILGSVESSTAKMPVDYEFITARSTPELMKTQPGTRLGKPTSGVYTTEGEFTQTEFLKDVVKVEGTQMVEVGGTAYEMPLEVKVTQEPAFKQTIASSRTSITPEYEGVYRMGKPTTTYGEVFVSEVEMGKTQWGSKVSEGVGEGVSRIQVGKKFVPFEFKVKSVVEEGEWLIGKAKPTTIEKSPLDFSGKTTPIDVSPDLPKGSVKMAKPVGGPEVSITEAASKPLDVSLTGAISAQEATAGLVYEAPTLTKTPYRYAFAPSYSGTQGTELYDGYVELATPPGQTFPSGGMLSNILVGGDTDVRYVTTGAPESSPPGGMWYGGKTKVETKYDTLGVPTPTISSPRLAITEAKTTLVPKLAELSGTRLSELQGVGLGKTTELGAISAVETSQLTRTKMAEIQIPKMIAPSQAIVPSFIPFEPTPPAPQEEWTPVPLAGGLIPFGAGGGGQSPDWGFGFVPSVGKGRSTRLKPTFTLLDVFAIEARTGKEAIHPTGRKATRLFESTMATGGEFTEGIYVGKPSRKKKSKRKEITLF